MKKILIAIIILILTVLGYLVLIKGFKIGNLEIKSISDIKANSEKLDSNIKLADECVSITYPAEVDKVNNSIKKLKDTKERYMQKTKNDEIKDVGVAQIKYYEIDYLWAMLGNYATKEKIELTLDIGVANADEDIYNLNFTLTGSYMGITDFIYSIENDENLKFKIQKFELKPTVTEKVKNKNEVTEKTIDTNKLVATFSVLDIGITLD